MENSDNSCTSKINGYCVKTTVKPRTRHLLDLNAAEKKAFLDSFDVVLSDCDGVVWMMVEPIPNTGPAIMLLKSAGKSVKFISNNSLRTDEEYISKLSNIGVEDVQRIDVVHPVKTITRYIQKYGLHQPLYSICSREFNEVLTKNGIKLITMEPATNLTLPDLVAQVKPNEKVGGVIADLNLNITFSQLARAQQYLQAGDCPLLVGASDLLMPVSDNFVTIGPGGFVDILCKTTGTEPVILGKPGASLAQDLIELYGLQNKTQRALFIGDSLTMDMKFGKNSGFQTLFVLSGAGTYEEMMKLSDDEMPDYYADGLADFITFFESL